MKKIKLLVLMIGLLSCSVYSQNLQEVLSSGDFGALRNILEKNGNDVCIEGVSVVNEVVRANQLGMLKKLKDQEIDINLTCANGYTALMTAAINDNVEAGKLLIELGADVGAKNKNGRTALDIANNMNHVEFLQRVYKIKMKHLVDIDGPYVLKSGNDYNAYSIQKNEGGLFADNKIIKESNLYTEPLQCRDSDGNKLFEFNLRPVETKQKSNFKMPKSLVAISDIEGNFEAFANLLRSTKVIDENYKWQFGSGHLVLVGDFFDRGKMVTECLWLIYKLEEEAKENGGRVHFIIGNHEIMNLRGDYRYVQKKYLINAQLMGQTYGDLFSPNTILGSWIRSKNSMVKIGNYLFVHGGIHPDLAFASMTLQTINNTIRNSIDKYNEELSAIVNGEFLINELGPLWYRGHFDNSHNQQQLEEVLNYFNARYLVVGHTPVPKIKGMYKNRIIAIDVPHSRGPKSQEALVLIKGKPFISDIEGNLSELK